ncbi:MAG: cob(I)yrinic acid a,c-diamide adenosyltransferase [Spirochaetaceae bacterium]
MKRIEFDKVTTRGGDDGRSSLYSGERRFKDEDVFWVLGDLDELMSVLGIVRRAMDASERLRREIRAIDTVQHTLMTVCTVLATAPGSEESARVPNISDRDVEKLERREKALLDRTTIGGEFVLPGAQGSSIPEIDLARAVTRRCERRIVTLIRSSGRADEEARVCRQYVNRLSDYLFVLARYCEQQSA